MTELPAGWIHSTIGEMCVSTSKVEPTALDRESISYIDIGGIEAGGITPTVMAVEDAPSRARQLVQAGDTLFSTVRPYLRKIAMVPPSLCGEVASTGFCILRSHRDFDSKLLYYYVNSEAFLGELLPKQRGASYPAVRNSDVFGVSIPIPPIEEQRRIVAALEDHLSRLDAASSSTKSAHRRVSHLRNTIETSVGNGSILGLEASPTAPPPTSATNDGDLFDLPPDWQWVRLEDIAEVVGGITKNPKSVNDASLRSVPYLRVANVQRGRLSLDNVTTIRASDKKIAQLTLRPGDVLLNEGGDRDKLGRGWIWEGQLAECIHQNHVFRARIFDNILDPKLLALHANSFGRSWFERNAKQSVNLASISISKVKQFPVPVPPQAIQEDLVKAVEHQLANLEALERSIAQATTRASHLRAALLREAFSGRLVPQDPSDEPASDLLARIRAEREAAAPRKRAPRPRRKPPSHSESSPSGFVQETLL